MKNIRSKAFTFDTITLEGSLFMADLLEKAALGTANHQTPADFQLPRGLRLSDEYGRSFQIATAIWLKFQAEKEAHTGRESAHTKTFMSEFPPRPWLPQPKNQSSRHNRGTYLAHHPRTKPIYSAGNCSLESPLR